MIWLENAYHKVGIIKFLTFGKQTFKMKQTYLQFKVNSISQNMTSSQYFLCLYCNSTIPHCFLLQKKAKVWLTVMEMKFLIRVCFRWILTYSNNFVTHGQWGHFVNCWRHHLSKFFDLLLFVLIFEYLI